MSNAGTYSVHISEEQAKYTSNKYEFNKHHFIARSLFSYIKLIVFWVHVYVFYHLILLLCTIVSTILPICVNMCTCHVLL